MSRKIVSGGSEQHELDIAHDGSRFRAGVVELEVVAIHGGYAEIRTGGRTHHVAFAITGTTVSFSFDGEIYTFEVNDATARPRARHGAASTAAPMPGSVLKILTATGSVVTKGAPLLILEAMKMEHQIVAPYDGEVTAINCREGELVQPGVDLITIKPTL